MAHWRATTARSRQTAGPAPARGQPPRSAATTSNSKACWSSAKTPTDTGNRTGRPETRGSEGWHGAEDRGENEVRGRPCDYTGHCPALGLDRRPYKPANEHATTSRNTGILALDILAENVSVNYWQKQASPEANVIKVNKSNVKGGKRQVAFIKPLPYVNTSGKPASNLFARYKVSAKELLEIRDELNIPLGQHHREDGRRAQRAELDHRQTWQLRVLTYTPTQAIERARGRGGLRL